MLVSLLYEFGIYDDILKSSRTNNRTLSNVSVSGTLYITFKNRRERGHTLLENDLVLDRDHVLVILIELYPKITSARQIEVISAT